MNRLALPAGNLSRFAKKAAELLFVVVAILAISVPMFSQGAVGTILGGVYDTTGGCHCWRAGDHHRRSTRHDARADD